MQLIDYSSTKGAVVSLTRVLAKSLASQGIRVNCVAPGPIWTLSFPPASLLKMCRYLEPKRQWVVQANHMSWQRPMSISDRVIRRT